MILSKKTWTTEASRVVRAALARQGVTYAQLVDRLREHGIEETVDGIKGKIHRGTFSFVFVLQVMRALDKDRISIE